LAGRHHVQQEGGDYGSSMREDATATHGSEPDATRGGNRGRPCHVTVKPVGALCALECSYCYYAQADKLAETGGRKSGIMSDATMAQLMHDLIDASDAPEMHICWHGGEPLLAGLSFYQRVIEVQAQLCPPGRRFVNALQTSGIGLDADWTRFFGRHGFLVGLSIDGPKFLHDRCRRDHMGRSRFGATLAAAERLIEGKVQVNSLTTVGAHNVEHGARIYRFLKALGFRFMQFIPIVERMGANARPARPPSMPGPDEADAGEANLAPTPWSVPAHGFGQFLRDVFDAWMPRDRSRISVQNFDLLLGAMLGAPSGLCVHAESCGDCLALEADGSLYPCDHYVYPQLRLGQLGQQKLGEMVAEDRQRAFGRWKWSGLPQACRSCAFRRACHGGCPKHRFVTAEAGPPDNYLCPSYRQFFSYAVPRLADAAAKQNTAKRTEWGERQGAQSERARAG
jgi:uncharacterized protein